MSITILTDLTNANTQTKRNSLIKLQLDVVSLVNEMNVANDCILKAQHKDEAIRKMAQSVIQSAQEDELIPYKTNYRIRMRQKYKILKEVYKSGKKAGQHRQRKLTPSNYYRYDTKKLKNVYTSKDVNTNYTEIEKWESREYEYRSSIVYHDNLSGVFGWATIKNPRTGNLTTYPIRLSFGWRERVGHTTKDISVPNTRTWNRGEGTIVTPTGKTTTQTNRKRRYWKHVKDISSEATEYNKTYTSEKDKKGYYHYVMNRTPHLRDTDLTHVVTMSKHMANIRISIRKPKDTRFYEEGGVNYAYWQYMGGEEESDASWDRATENTTMRWLEVAMGLYKPKRPVIAHPDRNYSRMKDILQQEIDMALKANGVQIK